jgi:hypothetical protein
MAIWYSATPTYGQIKANLEEARHCQESTHSLWRTTLQRATDLPQMVSLVENNLRFVRFDC